MSKGIDKTEKPSEVTEEYEAALKSIKHWPRLDGGWEKDLVPLREMLRSHTWCRIVKHSVTDFETFLAAIAECRDLMATRRAEEIAELQDLLDEMHLCNLDDHADYLSRIIDQKEELDDFADLLAAKIERKGEEAQQ